MMLDPTPGSPNDLRARRYEAWVEVGLLLVVFGLFVLVTWVVG
jgi:hypothetical protein